MMLQELDRMLDRMLDHMLDRMLFRKRGFILFFDDSLRSSPVDADEDGNVLDSPASASAIDGDPDLAIMRRDMQDPKLYKIYEGLSKLR